MATGYADLGIPTISGLKTLNLDELNTTNLNSDFIDGNLIYYNKIEGNEIIVDTKLTLTNTGVISVGSSTISDIELTYLDGVSSNIQTQINNINTNNSGLTATVNQHTAQITALESSDTTQNTTLATHTSQITAIETVNATQTTDINNLNFAVVGQSAVITSLGTDVSALQTKTQNITATATETTMTKPLYINSNGQSNISSIEMYDSFSGNRTGFYPNITAASFNNIVQSGDQAIVARGTVNTEVLNLTTHSTVSSGLRISPSNVVMGYGGLSINPTNRVTCNIGAVNIYGTLNLDCGNAKITTAGNMTVGIINSNASGESI